MQKRETRRPTRPTRYDIAHSPPSALSMHHVHDSDSGLPLQARKNLRSVLSRQRETISSVLSRQRDAERCSPPPPPRVPLSRLICSCSPHSVQGGLILELISMTLQSGEHVLQRRGLEPGQTGRQLADQVVVHLREFISTFAMYTDFTIRDTGMKFTHFCTRTSLKR